MKYLVFLLYLVSFTLQANVHPPQPNLPSVKTLILTFENILYFHNIGIYVCYAQNEIQISTVFYELLEDYKYTEAETAQIYRNGFNQNEIICIK